MSDRNTTRGNFSAALANLVKLLPTNPALAETQAREILRVLPDQPETLSLYAAALAAQGKLDAAVAPLQHLTARAPQHRSAWRDLGDLYTAMGNADAANDAYLRHVGAAVGDRAMIEASTALSENRLAEAETILRAILKNHPTDVAALRMLADVGARSGRLEEAEGLLKRTLELCPSFDAARAHYAAVLNRQLKSDEALAQVEILRRRDPRHPGYLTLEAAVLARLGEMDGAIAAYKTLLQEVPNQSKVWLSYGHTLKTAGRYDDAVNAYRQSVTLQPSLGEAWWSLANLKKFCFTDDDVAAMRTAQAQDGLSDDDRLHLDFALGKAFEDRKDYATSFAHYEAANARRRQNLDYRADETTAYVNRLKSTLTADFFEQRAGAGCQAPDPIFIVGLPRSGSTLVEQILASHSAVEGTMELPDIFAIAEQVRAAAGQPLYPDALAALTADRRTALGEEYLARTRVHRKLGRPFFIDKMPNNFLHIGLIALILPNAKIVDVRRRPMGCCFSCFKQHFARGQGFSYSLTDLGRYYADYVALMAHFDAALPGRIVRVTYEDLVADLETNVRRLLAACDLPYEEECLRFYQNGRIVRTASSEQVRQPIFTDAVEHWRAYEAWLAPLKNALGPTA